VGGGHDVAATHLERLGDRARPAGGAAVGEARAYCARALRDAGFVVHEHSFEYSALPGELGGPLAGLFGPLLATGAWAARNAGPATWIGGLVVLIAAALFARRLGGDAVLDLPLMRRRGTNVEAVRGSRGGDPAVWLVAHLDSKWQPVPMLARVCGVVLMGFGAIGVVLGAVLNARAWWPLVVVWLGGIPLLASFVGARNHGTLDNASGVAAVLEAAESVPPDANIGVLISDAEELALAGARAWLRARQGRRPGGVHLKSGMAERGDEQSNVALNCDSIDDEGPLTVMYHRGVPSDLVPLMRRAARACGEPLRVIRLLPGILTDSVAFARAGWRTVTLSRGTLRTLSRIHTSHDTLRAMRGTGVAGAAQVLARAATELTNTMETA
jgi:hypothetical protein